jgi:formylmethanofuran dehydrogenase subunit E
MAIAGLTAIGIEDPKGKDRSKVMVFVETDRCVSDAVTAVTGCTPGTRTLKIIDYGKIAATFLNLETGEAVRVSVRSYTENKREARDGECRFVPSDTKPFMGLSDKQLFHFENVDIVLPPEDVPGTPPWATVCERCGAIVMDMRFTDKNGRRLCRPCAEGVAYYSKKSQRRTASSPSIRMVIRSKEGVRTTA